MTDKPAVNLDHLDLDADGRLDQDLICLKCGYNLRGLSPEGRCPECGTAVGRSLHGDRLQYCDPQWVDKLASGMNWLWWSVVWFLLIPVQFLLAELLIRSLYSFLPYYLYLSCGLGFIGLWFLTAPEPARIDIEKFASSRRITRYLLYLLIPNLAVSIPCLVIATSVNGLFQIFLISALVLMAAIVISSLAYARSLAYRGSNEWLAKITHFVMIGWGVSLSILLFGGSDLWLPASTPLYKILPSGLQEILSALFVIGIIFLIMFGIGIILLVERYAWLLRGAAESARLSWAKEPFALVRPPDHR